MARILTATDFACCPVCRRRFAVSLAECEYCSLPAFPGAWWRLPVQLWHIRAGRIQPPEHTPLPKRSLR